MTQTGTTREGWRAGIVAIAPAVLLAGFVYHPYIGVGPPDEAAIAAAVVSDTTRWGLSHLTVGAASGLVVLAFLAIRSYLREVGEERWSALAVPFIVIGGTLYAMLPGMELAATLAAAETGTDVQAAQTALVPWFLPVIMSAALTFAVGIFGLARGIADSKLLSPGLTHLVVAALAVMAAARFVPLSAVQFYVQGAAGIVALWPLAYRMWKHPKERPTGSPRPVPTT